MDKASFVLLVIAYILYQCLKPLATKFLETVGEDLAKDFQKARKSRHRKNSKKRRPQGHRP